MLAPLAPPWCRRGHLQGGRGRSLSQEDSGVEEGKVRNEGRREGRVGDIAGLGLAQEPGRGHHAHHADELCLRNPGQVGDLLSRDASGAAAVDVVIAGAGQRDTCQNLEVAEPLEACEELILRRGSSIQ